MMTIEISVTALCQHFLSHLKQISEIFHEGVSTLDGSRMEVLLPTICALIRDSSQFYTKQEISKEKRGRMESSSSGVLDVTMEDTDKSLSVTTKQPIGETQVNNTLSQNVRNPFVACCVF